MNSGGYRGYDADSSKGLPPVTPPSGKFMAQLFLVPLLIVGGIALVFFGVVWMFGDVFGGLGGSRTPAQFLDRIDNTNLDQRWRAASDLAQVLLRDDKLASNSQFALDLTDRLRKAMEASAAKEKAILDRLEKYPKLAEKLNKLVQKLPVGERDPNDVTNEWSALESDWKKLEPELNFILFLSSSLGNFMVPVGAPLLAELATQEGADVSVIEAQKRRQAVWALANLGDNLRRFDRLPADQQEAVLTALDEETKGGSSARADLARAALENLRSRQAGKFATMGVAPALVKCAEVGYPREKKRDPYLREFAGFAMGFWQGTPEENKAMDDALIALTQDDGHGNELLLEFSLNPENQKNDSRPVTRDPGARIQYNAAAALARRGSDRARLDMLEDMLDEELQTKQNVLRKNDGTEGPDEGTAFLTVRTTLQALALLAEKQPSLVAARPSLLEAVEKLSQSKYAEVRMEAERTKLMLKPKS